jgi:hypothetical protein
MTPVGRLLTDSRLQSCHSPRPGRDRRHPASLEPVLASGERPLNGNPLSTSCLSPHPFGGTGGGIHSTSHTLERSTSGHCARTRLRVLARSSSGVRASFFSIIDSLSSSCMHAGERMRCNCSASDSSRLIGRNRIREQHQSQHQQRCRMFHFVCPSQ